MNFLKFLNCSTEINFLTHTSNPKTIYVMTKRNPVDVDVSSNFIIKNDVTEFL